MKPCFAENCIESKGCWRTRLMRADNLLARQDRKFLLRTDSSDETEIYLNLARRLRTTGPNQLWIAGVTYIRLREEFVYLAVILDAYSRRVVGWALDRTLRARLSLCALEQAIMSREPPADVVHHSDRGVQYASGDYVRMLRDHGMMPSMSPLKREEIYANEYRDLGHLLENIEAFIDRYYKRVRLHSALGYRSPEEFEREFGSRNAEAGFAGPVLKFLDQSSTSRRMRERSAPAERTGSNLR